MGVLTRVLLHLVGQRPHTPISQLVLLVSQNLAVGLEQEGKAELPEAQRSGSLSSVEHVDDVEAEVSLQPLDILTSTVEHLDDLRIIEDAS